MKCENCGKECCITEIENYVVEYQSLEAYNCCSKECANKCANADGITDDEIVFIR